MGLALYLPFFQILHKQKQAVKESEEHLREL